MSRMYIGVVLVPVAPPVEDGPPGLTVLEDIDNVDNDVPGDEVLLFVLLFGLTAVVALVLYNCIPILQTSCAVTGFPSMGDISPAG